MTQTAYSYDPNTGEYLGTTVADESPLETGTYLYPAYSTDKQPPTPGNNQAAVFQNGAWTTVPDYRNTTYYDSNGSPHTIDKLNVSPPSNSTKTQPLSQRLSEVKQTKMAEIQASADAAMAAPISFTNAAGTQATFPMDQNSWLKYLASYTRYVVHGKAMPSNGVSFMDVQGNPIPMTVADIDSMSDPVFNQIETVEQKAAGFYSQINAVTTSTSKPIQTVQSVVWS